MCGIYASVSRTKPQRPSSTLCKLLCNRGPDLCNTVDGEQKFGNETVYSSFTSTVLALRGGTVTAQPLQDPSSTWLLCWNGEAWTIGNSPVQGNDGLAVLNLLVGASRDSGVNGILDVLRSIAGPFAFVFHDTFHNLLFFGRDRLGRRSLLHDEDKGSVTLSISSVADPGFGSWKEVEADGIYMISMGATVALENAEECQDIFIGENFHTFRLPWTAKSTSLLSAPMGSLNRATTPTGDRLKLSSPFVAELREHIFRSLELRTLDIPLIRGHGGSENVRLAVLFSGGLDCTVLARIVHEILPLHQEIDLLNVAFENPRVVLALKKEKQKGGVAGLSDDTAISSSSQDSPYENCPDRITGRSSLAELRSICPMRVWRFVEINVPYEETLAHKARVIALVHPHNTEMDLSIAYALYFAARGLGIASIAADVAPLPYRTPAPVLLSGLGADELFGGYIRHATAFQRHGYPGLLDEIELDVNRLGKRNLGRDDRVIANWGREARYPYLDESLVEMTAVDSEEPDIEPGKKILRFIAWSLGMHSVAKEKKRAIQFGARTAKMETGKTRGTTLIS